MTMRTMCALAVGALLAACGGSSDSGRSFKDPNSVTFLYGEKLAVLGTPYESAAGVNGEAAGGAAQGPTGDILQGFMLAAAPLIANEGIFDGPDLGMFSSSPVLQDPRMAILRGGVAGLVGAPVADPALNVSVDCSLTVNPLGLLVDHCKGYVNLTGPDSSLKASASLSGEFLYGAETPTLTWHFRLGVNLDQAMPPDAQSAALLGEFQGELTFDAGIDGYSRVSYALDLSDTNSEDPASNSSLTAAVTDQADYALTYDAVSGCVDGGVVRLKRVWTTRPTGTGMWEAYPEDFTDQSVELTFTATETACSPSVEYALGSLGSE